MENAQPVTHAVNQSGSQMAVCPSAENAELEGRSGHWNEHAENSPTQERVGFTQNPAVKESTQTTPQASRAPLSILVTNESGSNQLIVNMKPKVAMRKLTMNACARWGTPFDVSCFLLDGRRINPSDRPALVCNPRRLPL